MHTLCVPSSAFREEPPADIRQVVELVQQSPTRRYGHGLGYIATLTRNQWVKLHAWLQSRKDAAADRAAKRLVKHLHFIF